MLQIKAVISMVSGFRSSDFERKLQSDYRLLVFYRVWWAPRLGFENGEP